MAKWGNFDFLLYGIALALLIIVLWLIYAIYYRTSITRLSILAAKKYQKIAPPNESARYLIQTDETRSHIDESTGKFVAVITKKPDMNNRDAPPLPDVIMRFNIVYDDLNCNEQKNAAQYMTCINVN